MALVGLGGRVPSPFRWRKREKKNLPVSFVSSAPLRQDASRAEQGEGRQSPFGEQGRGFWLNVYGLYEVRVSGDGNCQFRALSDQLYRSPDYHKHVRKEIVKQFAAKICLLTSFRDTCFVEIVPQYQAPQRVAPNNSGVKAKAKRT
uniref:OTU domain-containing protein n=1 Tax=Oryza meridionalis TaxID=40149 RepID=A0A0E0DDK3_9ORYZ